MKKYKIAVIPGDGTGPEVVREGLKVLQAASKKYNFSYETTFFPFGGEYYKKTGETITSSDIERVIIVNISLVFSPSQNLSNKCFNAIKF